MPPESNPAVTSPAAALLQVAAVEAALARPSGDATGSALVIRNAAPGLCAAVRALVAERDALKAKLAKWPALECPCCGNEAAMAEFFEDGAETICGCGGTVMADGEDAHISLDECVNPACLDADASAALSAPQPGEGNDG